MIVIFSLATITLSAGDNTATVSGNSDSNISITQGAQEKGSFGQKSFFDTFFNQIALAAGAGVVSLAIWFIKQKKGSSSAREEE